MKRNERMDAAQGLLQECMSDLRAVERKARQALAWVADEEDAAPAPLMKSVAEFAIGVAHEGEVALNVMNRVRNYADMAAAETPDEMDELARKRDRRPERDLPGEL